MRYRNRVLVIIVTYNSRYYIDKCLQSLINQTYSLTDILIVDNASSDETVRIVRDNFPKVNIIQLDKNMGFASGNNIGIRFAIDNQYDYTLLINEDTIADCNLVERLLKYANAYTVVAPDMYSDFELTKLWYSNGDINYLTGNVSNVTVIDDGESVHDVNFISGCCELVHTDIWKMVGGFGEEFFLYYEDVDLSMKMSLNHIAMKCVHETWIWHRIRKSGRKPYYYYYMTRNKFLFLEKYQDCFKYSLEHYIDDYCKRWTENKMRGAIIQAEKRGIEDFRNKVIGRVDNLHIINDNSIEKKLKTQYDLLNSLFQYSMSSINPGRFLKQKGYEKIAIYGNHYLGQRLCDWLMYNDIYIEFFIDKKSGRTYRNIVVCNPEERLESVDLIIITPVINCEGICENLSAKTDAEIITLENFIVEIENNCIGVGDRLII